jgi:hypothetical protein
MRFSQNHILIKLMLYVEVLMQLVHVSLFISAPVEGVSLQ